MRRPASSLRYAPPCFEPEIRAHIRYVETRPVIPEYNDSSRCAKAAFCSLRQGSVLFSAPRQHFLRCAKAAFGSLRQGSAIFTCKHFYSFSKLGLPCAPTAHGRRLIKKACKKVKNQWRLCAPKIKNHCRLCAPTARGAASKGG